MMSPLVLAIGLHLELCTLEVDNSPASRSPAADGYAFPHLGKSHHEMTNFSMLSACPGCCPCQRDSWEDTASHMTHLEQ